MGTRGGDPAPPERCRPGPRGAPQEGGGSPASWAKAAAPGPRWTWGPGLWSTNSSRLSSSIAGHGVRPAGNRVRHSQLCQAAENGSHSPHRTPGVASICRTGGRAERTRTATQPPRCAHKERPILSCRATFSPISTRNKTKSASAAGFYWDEMACQELRQSRAFNRLTQKAWVASRALPGQMLLSQGASRPQLRTPTGNREL